MPKSRKSEKGGKYFEHFLPLKTRNKSGSKEWEGEKVIKKTFEWKSKVRPK